MAGELVEFKEGTRKDGLVIEITRIIFEKKKVNKYNNYTCEHAEHLLYQNKNF